MRPTDITIKNVSFSTEDFSYRTMIKFGGVAVDRVTMLNAEVEVVTSQGKRSVGKGSMPLGNIWAFPSKTMVYDKTLGAMKAIAESCRAVYAKTKTSGHPIEITWELEKELLSNAEAEGRKLNLDDPIPPLATLVCASPFDAALHDAYGKAHQLNCYHTYGGEFLDNDLGRFLGSDFKGVKIEDHVMKEPVASLPLYHLVGALDPLFSQDVLKHVGDGLPETLGEWVLFNGLTHLKIKLNGDDLGWDVGRVVGVEKAAEVAQKQRGQSTWHYSLDFNEKCKNVEYLLEFLEQVKEKSPAAFSRIAYIEQPTGRDLKASRANVMHAASKQIPVVIDESLLDLESLLMAREMGYTGAALKACKGQSQSVVLASAARHMKMFLCVQDLTCPGASLIQSASLAAHVKGVSAIEANSRQYCPAANTPWENNFPGIFKITNGSMQTSCLNGVGLGAYPK
ncbi:MAG: enolase C-terminal domain-like protein [Gemmataceae bacterium]